MLKRIFFNALLVILAFVLFDGCSTSVSLTKGGFKEYEKGRYSKAIVKFNKAIEKDHTNGKAYYGICLCDFENKSYESALKYCNKAIQYNWWQAPKKRAEIYYNLALKERYIEPALELCNKALSDNNTYAKAREYRGQLYYQLGTFNRKNRKYKTAFEYLNKAALDNKSLLPYIQLTRGEIYADQYNYDQAIYYTKKAHMHSPLPQASYNLASFYSKIGEKSKAFEYLFEFYEMPSTDYEKYQQIAINNQTTDFYSIRNDIKFRRWLSKYRRIKLSIIGAQNLPKGDTGFFVPRIHEPPDPYVIVGYNRKVILCTDVRNNSHSPSWHNNYVIFDYEIGKPLFFYVRDLDDLNTDDNLIYYTLYDVKDGTFWISQFVNRRRSFYTNYPDLKFKIEDSNNYVYSTNTKTPVDLSGTEVALGVMAAGTIAGALAYASSSEDDSDSPSFEQILNRLKSCVASNLTGRVVDDPILYGAIAEAIAVGFGKKEYSLINAGEKSAIKYISNELRRSGHHEAADFITSGRFVWCTIQSFR